MPGGSGFADVAESERLPRRDKDQLARALAGKVPTSATGAAPDATDRAEVKAVVARVCGTDYGFRAGPRGGAGRRVPDRGAAGGQTPRATHEASTNPDRGGPAESGPLGRPGAGKVKALRDPPRRLEDTKEGGAARPGRTAVLLGGSPADSSTHG